MFHGTRGIPDQIIKKLALAQHAKGHIVKNVQKNNAVKEFTESLLDLSDPKNVINVNNGIKFVPPLRQKIPEVQHSVENFPANVEGMAVAQRMIKDGQVYHSSIYSRKKKSASYLVQFSEEGSVYLSKVDFYLKNGDDEFAVINMFQNLQLNVTEINIPQPEDPVLKEFWSARCLGSHFTAVQRTQECKYVECTKIQHRIVFVESEEPDVDGYVSTVLKSYQHD